MSLDTVYVCQKFFSNPLILITFAMTILVIGVIAFVIQVVKTRAYLKKYLSKRFVIPKSLKTAINNLDLSGKVDVVKDDDKFSFCHGLLRPRICLSTGLLKTLTPTELKAVLLHENYHFKKHDPLRMILSKTISSMFFFIPILGDLQKHYVLTKEIAADEVVIKNGGRESLMFVLSKILVGDSLKFSGVAALANLDLEKRILYLTGNQKKAVFKPSLVSISLSAFIGLFLMVVVNTPVYAVRVDDSCKAKEEVNYSKDVIYTPANYTPK